MGLPVGGVTEAGETTLFGKELDEALQVTMITAENRGELSDVDLKLIAVIAVPPQILVEP